MRRSTLAAMAAGHAVDDFYQGAVPALIPFMCVAYHYGYTAASGITLAATLLSSIAQPLFGVLTDRRRMAWLVPAGVTVAGAGLGLSGLSHHYWWVWAAVAVSGLGVAAYHPEASRAARAVAGPSAQGMSVFALGGNVGFALAPLIVTPLIAALGLSATPMLVLPAMAGAAGLMAMMRTSRRHDAPPTHHTAADADPASAGSSLTDDDWGAFGWLTAVVMCRSVTFFGLSSLLLLYLVHHLGAGHTATTTALTAFFTAGVAGTLAGGWLADRYGRLLALRAGYTLTIPGLALLVLAPNTGVAIGAAVLLGLALYLPFSVHVTLGQEYLPTRVGTASGLTLGLAVSAGGILAPGFGLLADHAGPTAALCALLAFPVASLVISINLPDTHRRPPAPHEYLDKAEWLGNAPMESENNRHAAGSSSSPGHFVAVLSS